MGGRSAPIGPRHTGTLPPCGCANLRTQIGSHILSYPLCLLPSLPGCLAPVEAVVGVATVAVGLVGLCTRRRPRYLSELVSYTLAGCSWDFPIKLLSHFSVIGAM